MNFHQKRDSISSLADYFDRYQPVYSRENQTQHHPFEHIKAVYTAPILGSRWIFPRRFDEAFHRLVDGGEARNVIPAQAVWYFGASLHLEVEPLRLRRRISDWVEGRRGVRWIGSSFLDCADWSAAITPLDESPVHREMQEIVAAGGDLRDTRAYRNLMLGIERGTPSRRNKVRLASVEAVEAYLRYCRDLIKSMRKRGALRHSESGAFHRLRVKHREARSPMHDSTERDIGVAIAENGELIRHLGGKHRTAIAQALKLPSLPVEIHMVHTGWLQRQINRTGLPPHLALADGVRHLASNDARASTDANSAST